MTRKLKYVLILSQMRKIKLFFLILIFFSSLGSSFSFELKTKEIKYFVLKWEGNPFGWWQYSIPKKMRLAKEEFYQIKSVGRLKIGMGEAEDLSYASETVINAKNFLPSFFSALQKNKAQELKIQILFSESLGVQKNIRDKNLQTFFNTFNSPHYLFINNLWGKIDTFLENWFIYSQLIKEKINEIYIYDPISRESAKINFNFLKKENLEINNKKYSCLVYALSAAKPLSLIYLEEKSFDLIKVEEINGGISFELSAPSIKEEIKKSSGLNLWEKRVAVCNYLLPYPKNLDYLKIQIELNLKPPGSLNHQILGFSQNFSGEIKDNHIKGTMEIKTQNPSFVPFSFPIKEDFKNFDNYLKSQFKIESDNSEIKTKAQNITWKSTDAKSAVNKLIKWIKEEIKINQTLPSAKLTLENKIGNSEGIAYLMTAFCRSLGIPAKTAGGLIYANGLFIPHYWLEVYISKEGWTAVDPAYEEIGKLSALHIYLWEEGDLSGPKIKVLDYAPRLAETLPYLKKELSWKIGEERIYQIKNKGEIIGKEKIKLKEITFLKEEESYLLESELNLKTSDNTLYQAQMKFYLTPEGLPLNFKIKNLFLGKESHEEYNFQKNEVNLIKNQNEFTLPVPRGVYLYEKNFPSALALILGQIPEIQMGKKYNLSIFIPETREIKNLEINLKEPEKIKINQKEYQALSGEFNLNNQNIIFWITKEGKLLKTDSDEIEIEYLEN
ncbi:MAG: hypothetical protein HYU63_04325 [Armatimonadetes bacterium]|nr:hypothetical protein [Armatimonadota bacterium]